MSGTIRLNAEGLTSSASQLRGKGQELESLINALQGIVDRLPEDWEGQAALAYGEQFASLRPGLNETRELVESIAVQIEEVLRLSQELDGGMAGQLRSGQ